MSALELRQVAFTYPGADRPALHGCSLAVEAGQVTWLTGALGAGTSTALLLAAGLAPRHTGGTLEGTVLSLGHDPAAHEAQGVLAGRIALVMATPATQLSGIAETVWQEVAFAPANLGWPVERIRSAVQAAVTALGIAALAERDPATLSGGELQRTVLAAMLVLAPDLWLLDEPASALDGPGRAVLARLLKSEAARGAAVVVASEDADWLAAVADRMVVFQQGRPALDGRPDVLLREEAVWQAGAGATTIAEVARAAGVATRRPLTVEEGVRRWGR